uniref:Orphan protein n=1 Tax=Heterorhabditis bacteriophora TaxID=37862 RepID=A0A1I7WSQ0_HETBA
MNNVDNIPKSELTNFNAAAAVYCFMIKVVVQEVAVTAKRQ